ncbi:MAG: hypothetical protein HFG22_16990 [Lachnospiraceae bacterium]|nr:hypothetical protein [Lachnospiraceae bacterium]
MIGLSTAALFIAPSLGNVKSTKKGLLSSFFTFLADLPALYVPLFQHFNERQERKGKMTGCSPIILPFSIFMPFMKFLQKPRSFIS